MRIRNYIISAFTLSLLILNIYSPALAETAENKSTEKTDVKANPDKTEEPQTGEDDTDDPEVEKNVSKVKIGGRNISAYTRKGQTYTGAAIGGYFDTEYYIPADRHSFFDQHHVILQASALLHERIFFNTEIEYEHGAILGYGTNDGELKIEQAWLDFKIMDWLIFRGGALLIPMGRLNILHDSDFRATTARPLFSSVIIPTTWMEPGFGFYGTIIPNDEIEINYDLYMTQGLIDKIEDGNGLKGAKPSLGKDNNANKALTGRVGLSPFIGLEFGLSGYYAAFDEKNQKNIGIAAADFNFKSGPFELLGEAGFTSFSPADQKDAAGKVISTLQGPMWGYYIEGHYNFFPEFLRLSFLGKDFDKPTFTLVSRIDQVDTDVSKLNVNDRTVFTVGFNYRPITSVVFKFEYQVNIENEAILKGDVTKEGANNQFIASVAAGF